MKIYLAEFKYSKANSVEVTVTKETPKQYQYDKKSKGVIIGDWFYLSGHVNKTNHACEVFTSRNDAITWLIEINNRVLNQTREQVERLEQQAAMLEGLK